MVKTSKNFFSPKLSRGENDLSSQRPDLIREWDYEKNDSLFPENITVNSGVKVWWKCSICGFSWETSVSHRNYGRGCPNCAKNNKARLVSLGKTHIGVNDLESQRPDLLKEWDYTKNTSITPSTISVASSKKVWWKCSKGHEWLASVGARKRGDSCPYCSGKKALVGFNDLTTLNPELAKQWNYERNDGLVPEMFTCNSGKKVWWKGPCGHEWESTITHRNHGSGCPTCNKERRTSFPEQALFFYIKQYFPKAENGNTTAIGMELDIWIPDKNIAIEYDGVAWHKDNPWECVKNQLCIQKNIQLIRIREEGLSKTSDCICITREHTNTRKSLNKCIIEVLQKLLGEDCFFDIDVDRDSALILNQFVNKKKKLSLSTKYPQIAKDWDYSKNGSLKPEQVSPYSNKRVWWKCSKCGYEWNSKIEVRSLGKGCPNCIKALIPDLISQGKLKIGVNDLKACNPVLAAEWNYERNKGLMPNQVTMNSAKKVWWKCSKCGHEWKSTVYNRNNNHGCPYCAGRRPIQNIETGEIFNTIVEAGKKYGIRPSNIARVLKNKGKTAGGFHWSYYDSKSESYKQLSMDFMNDIDTTK